ncbi:ribonuclease domain-containing protein, partial [Streptomyces graminilatus]|uniref:ribonuclease domain-containing protein n=1 Tax=Streptomyces graminilatus TaxID=1464070 RepID=UPI000AB61CFA
GDCGVWSNQNYYQRLRYQRGAGWPGWADGGHWYGYWEPAANWGRGANMFLYYGGTFHDYGNRVSNQEIQRGAGRSDAHASYTDRFGQWHRSTYVEYDIDFHSQARAGRDAPRIVRDFRTGDVYATFDHYNRFHYLGRFQAPPRPRSVV